MSVQVFLSVLVIIIIAILVGALVIMWAAKDAGDDEDSSN